MCAVNLIKRFLKVKKMVEQIYEVSVIIPTADRSEMVNRAIRSVIGQTINSYKIIVVDNGRKKAQLDEEIVDAVEIVRTEPRIGPGRSRNIGAGVARSHYVAFLDDDDVWEPAYLEQSLAVFEQEGADAVVGQLKRACEDGVVRPYKIFPADRKTQRSIYFRNPGFGGQNIVIKKDFFFRVGGFDETMPASVDRDLCAKILQSGGKIVPQPLSVAILCDHGGDRVRASELMGNWMFIRKHWREMVFSELAKASVALLKKYFKKRTLRQ